jgi:hypothetical protein
MLGHYSILSFTFYQLKLFFMCKHNRNTNVLSDFTCFVCVFDTPYETATNSACHLSDHGKLIVFYQVINIISILFFFITFNLSPSREWISWRTLVLCNDTSVNWRYQHHWFIAIIIVLIVLFYVRIYVVTKCCQTSLYPIAFRVFLAITGSLPVVRYLYQLSVC